MRSLRKTTICVGVLCLAACRAEEVQFDLDQSDLVGAAEGQPAMVDFEAVFEQFGDLEQEQRDQIAEIEEILERYLSIDDFELATTRNGFEVTVEGEIALTAEPQRDDAWYLQVAASDVVEGFNRVQLTTGADFEILEREMRAINFMLAPDAFHPTQFRVDATDLEIIAPAAQIEGRFYLLWRGQVSERTNLNFAEGTFDEIGAGFLYRLQD